MDDKLIDWLDNYQAVDNELVGKKCANLGEMARIGLPVPPGFALTLTAYQVFMAKSGVKEKISRILNDDAERLNSIAGLNQLSDDIRALISDTPIPEEMEKLFTSFYKELCQKCGKEVAVSVRSAGAASHPGQFETYLNVKGEEELLSKIKRVWSSTFNSRSIAARKERGLALDEDPIGVAVLGMVDAKSAGVLFTADPNSGDESRMIIEANWGLGESVVGGESVPDVFVVDKETFEIVDKKMGSKSVLVDMDGDGVAEIETPEDLRNSFCLGKEETEIIANFGKQLEAHFNCPQDVEWAIDKGSSTPTVMLLQTRPAVIAKKKDAMDQIFDFIQDRFGL